MIDEVESLTVHMEIIGEDRYMKDQLTSIEAIAPKIDFDKTHVAVCRNGGMMAFVKKSDVYLMDTSNVINSNIRVFCQNGKGERTIYFPSDTKEKLIVLFAFTEEEKLISLNQSGTVTKFNIFNRSSSSFQYGNAFTKDYILKAKLFDKGFTALTKDGSFYIVRNFKEATAVLFYDIKVKLGIEPSTVTDFLFISPSNSKSGRVECIFASTAFHGIMIITEQDTPQIKELMFTMPMPMNTPSTSMTNTLITVEGIYHLRSKKRLEFKPNIGTDSCSNEDIGYITAIAASPDEKQIALYKKEDLKIHNAAFIFNATFDDNERINLTFPVHRTNKNDREKTELLACLSFNTNSQFLWCGSNSLCICFQRYICLVNIASGTLFTFQMTTKKAKNMTTQFMHCLTEVDGLRVIMNDKVLFINQITNEVMDACYACSEAAAKKLIIAFNSSEEKRPECDQQIRELMNDNYDLGDAVMMLVKASAQLWKCDIQKILLLAANYGKVFLSKDVFNYHEFLYVCRDIRILNNLRWANCPRYITFEEYRRITPNALLKRVMNMQEFFMAHHIAQQLKLKPRKVYQKWAIAQIKAIPRGCSAEDEDKYYEIIQKKISEIDSISYIKIAKIAFKYSRDIIGFRFLENEKSILIKIPQYMQMKKWEKALELTIETYDPNMLFTVIDVIYKLENIARFCSIISPYKKINSFVCDYLKKYHEADYVFYLEKNEAYEDIFYYYIEEYFKSNTINERSINLQLAKDNKKKIVVTKESTTDIKFYTTFLDDLEASAKMKKDLLKKDIIKQTDISTYDNATFDVYQSVIETSEDGDVESKYKKFDIYPRTMAVLRVRVLAQSRNQKVMQVVIRDEVKKEHLSQLNLGEIYNEIGDLNKAVDCLKMPMKADLFSYKLALLISMEKYQEALECVISDKDYDYKIQKVNEILQKAPLLKDSVPVLCKKYKVIL